MDNKQSTNEPITSEITKSISEPKELQAELEESIKIRVENTELSKLSFQNTMIAELQGLLDKAKNSIYIVTEPEDEMVKNSTITPSSLGEQNTAEEEIEGEFVIIKSDNLKAEDSPQIERILTEEENLKHHNECKKLDSNEDWVMFYEVNEMPTTTLSDPQLMVVPKVIQNNPTI